MRRVKGLGLRVRVFAAMCHIVHTLALHGFRYKDFKDNDSYYISAWILRIGS